MSRFLLQIGKNNVKTFFVVKSNRLFCSYRNHSLKFPWKIIYKPWTNGPLRLHTMIFINQMFMDFFKFPPQKAMIEKIPN